MDSRMTDAESPAHQSSVGLASMGRATSSVTWPIGFPPAIGGRRPGSGTVARIRSSGGAPARSAMARSRMSDLLGAVFPVANQPQVSHARPDIQFFEDAIVARIREDLRDLAFGVVGIAEHDRSRGARLRAGRADLAVA